MGNSLVNYVWTNYYLKQNFKEHECCAGGVVAAGVVSVVNETFFCDKSTDSLGNFTNYGKNNLKLLDFSFKVRPIYTHILLLLFLFFFLLF